jgi:hypothetical protein
MVCTDVVSDTPSTNEQRVDTLTTALVDLTSALILVIKASEDGDTIEQLSLDLGRIQARLANEIRLLQAEL